MVTFFRSSDRSSSITGEAPYATQIKDITDEKNGSKMGDIYTWRAGVRVPSTSNKTSLLTGLSAKLLEAILDETMVV
jgi:hypothetical protein